MKKIFIFFIFLLSLLIFTANYYITDKNIKSFIQKEFFKATGKKITFKKFSVFFEKGIKFNVEQVLIFEPKTKQLILKTGYLSFNVKIIPLFYRKIIFKNITIYNSELHCNLPKANYFNSNNKRKNKTIKGQKFNHWKIAAENIDVKNFLADLEIENHKIRGNVLKAKLSNFSLNKKFSFEIMSKISVDGEKGTVSGQGTFYLPRGELKANIKAKNLNMDFLKKIGISSSHCNITANIDGKYRGDSFVSLKIENIQFEKFSKFNHYIGLNAKYKFIDNSVKITNGKINLDNKLFVYARGGIDNKKDYKFNFKTNLVSVEYLKQYIGKKYALTLGKEGKAGIDNLTVSGNLNRKKSFKVNAKFNLIKCSGVCRKYPFKNLSFSGNFKNNKINIVNLNGKIKNSEFKGFNVSFGNGIITGYGLLNVDVSDIPLKVPKLELKKGILQLNLKKLYIPVKNFKIPSLKFQGNAILNNGIVSYDIFQNIKVLHMIIGFNNRVITLKKGNLNFRATDYLLKGKVTHYLKNPVALDFNISAATFDEFIAKKVLNFNMGTCTNIKANVNLKGSITDNGFKLGLDSGNVVFDNSSVNFFNRKINGIKGYASLNKNIVTLKNLFFIYNNGKYGATGYIYSPFKKHSIDIYATANVLDDEIAKIINIKRVENLNIKARLTGTFDKLKIKSASVNFNGSSLSYKQYHLSNLRGEVVYENNIADLKNVECSMNKINYIANGKIFYPFKNPSFSINVKTDKIDKLFLKEAGINSDTIENVEADINISGRIGRKMKLTFGKSVIILKHTKIYNFKQVTGKIFLNKNKVEFGNLEAVFHNGFVNLNGYLTTGDSVKKGYFSLYGKNLNFKNIHKNQKKPKKSKLKKKSKNKGIIKTLYKISRNLEVHITANLDNITSSTQIYRNINLNLTVNKKGYLINNCRLTTLDNGYFRVKTGKLTFGKPNLFSLEIEYDKINIADLFDFLIPNKDFEFYGKAKRCYIKINSKFQRLNEFEKKLNGKFNINYSKGFVNKVSTMANIFSILNVAQIFKFKLPDLNSKGFNYNSLKGDFFIKNGVVSTKTLKLKSDSINLIYFGDIDLVKKEYNANIAVYPLKTVDTILTHIPLIGYLFRDKRGGTGVIVTYFSIKGPLSKPSISLLPASTVTKKVEGILENIIKLPFSILTDPGSIIVPGSK